MALEVDTQRRDAWVATVTAMIVVAAFIAGKVARDAILLTSFGIEALPIFVAISALISLPVIVIAGRLMAHFGPGRLMPVLNGISAVLAVVEWFALERMRGVATIAIYFHLSIAGAILVSGFWSSINERFDVRTAKRHIGRIGVGATLGGILGGLIAQGTAVYLAPDQILLVLAGLQLGCAVTLYLVRTSHLHRPSPPQFALGVVTRSPLLRNLAAIVVLGAIAAGVLDYVFKADIVASSSQSGLLHALAIYTTITSVLTAIVQAVFAGPLIARLGVPRSVATLPILVTAGGLFALAAPVALAATFARAVETITRSSIYRAGYELIYAPLPEADKRPTKMLLDVGAERVGDLLGAQLVGLIVYIMVDPKVGLLIATVATAALAVCFAIRLPRNYSRALAESLIARDPESPSATSEPSQQPWVGESTLGQLGDLSPLPLRVFERQRKPAVAPTPAERDAVSMTITELRSRDSVRIKRALAMPLTPELAGLVIGLVARDDVGRAALDALRAIAPRCSGMIVDALLDPTREVIIRRRLPEVLFAGEPTLAAWGLWRGLADPSFEIRYRCGVVLLRLAAAGNAPPMTGESVFEVVRRELDPATWKTQRVDDDRVIGSLEDDEGTSLDHVFTVLGLALPAEPLRVALRAVQTDDAGLRETALEYLQSILPADVRIQLWPLLEGAVEAVPARESSRSHEELLSSLNTAYSEMRARREQRVPSE